MDGGERPEIDVQRRACEHLFEDSAIRPYDRSTEANQLDMGAPSGVLCPRACALAPRVSRVQPVSVR